MVGANKQLHNTGPVLVRRTQIGAIQEHAVYSHLKTCMIQVIVSQYEGVRQIVLVWLKPLIDLMKPVVRCGILEGSMSIHG